MTGRRGDERLREELEEHLSMQTDENIRAGMSPGEARRRARLKLGGAEAVREEFHGEESLALLENRSSSVLLSDPSPRIDRRLRYPH
jgi:hypothetical protein